MGSHIAAYLKTVTDYSVMMVDTRAAMFPHITRFCDVVADEPFASDLMLQAVRDYAPECIIHCADQANARKGLLSPLDMWEANASGVVRLLKACTQLSTNRFIFFSTADVYGPSARPSIEGDVLMPMTAYARTKLAMENLLRDCYVAHGLSSIVLRTSCIAGNHPLYDLGPLRGSQYLVPRIMESMLHGERLSVRSNKHQTPDGTAIRDYLHVMDVADAVLRALGYISRSPGCHIMNLSSGQGTSVREMINLAESLFSRQVSYSYDNETAQEDAVKMLDSSFARTQLGWKPTRGARDILLDSFKWYNGDCFKTIGFDHRLDD